jgi:hypothetical protein
MKNVVAINVSNLANRLPDDRIVVEMRFCGDFASDNHNVALHKGLTGHSAELVLRQAGVQDGIGNGVANLVRMAFTHGFGRENVTAAFTY